MRSRTPFFALLFTVGFFVLPHLAHASIPFFGPIIGDNNVCPAGWGMLMTVVNNIIELLLTIAIVFVTPLVLAYAGFLYVVNPFNPSGISKAKGILTNTIVGIVIALAGWMIVDAIMAVLYKSPNGTWGTWSSLITSSGDLCIKQAGALPQDPLNPTKTTPGVVTTGTGGTLSPGTGACDASVVQQAAATGGYTLTTAQANVLACIAKPESACGSNTSVAHQPDGTPTTATGAFQITFGAGTDKCHQLNLSVCSQAVNWTANGGNLNCSSVFTCSLSNPSACLPKPGKEANATACTTAALNLNCNASAAACMVASRNGGFGDWTSDPRSAIQTQCIDKYANS